MVKFAQASYLDSGYTPMVSKIAYIAAWLQTRASTGKYELINKILMELQVRTIAWILQFIGETSCTEFFKN